MGYGNFQATKLSTDIGAADATIKLDVLPKDKNGAVITSGRLVIEARKADKREIIRYTNVDLGTVSVTGVLRGQGGLPASPHTKGALVEMNPTAEDWEEALGVPQNIIERQNESLADFVTTPGGLVWSQVSLLTGQMAAGTYYLDGNRVVKAALASYVFPASKNIYVDIDAAGVLTYTPVNNNATTGFALAANRMRIAKVVTGVSTITSVQTDGFDILGNPIRPIASVLKALLEKPHYAKMGYSTGGGGGGQVISSQVVAVYDQLDTATVGFDTTNFATNRSVKTTRDGIYHINHNSYIADVSGGPWVYITWLSITYPGQAERLLRTMDRSHAVGVSQQYGWQMFLPAGSIIKQQIYAGGGALRCSAPGTSYFDRMGVGSTLSIAEIR